MTQERHDAGAPASQGGRFRATSTPDEAVTLTSTWDAIVDEDLESSRALSALYSLQGHATTIQTQLEAARFAQQVRTLVPNARRALVIDAAEGDRWRVDHVQVFDDAGEQITDVDETALIDIASPIVDYRDPEDLCEAWTAADTATRAGIALDLHEQTRESCAELWARAARSLARELPADALTHALRVRRGQERR